MIREDGCILGSPSNGCPRKNQLRPCAEHDFLDFKKNRDGILQHEIPISELGGDSDEENPWEPADPAPMPQQVLERTEFWNDVFDAAEELNPRGRELFLLRLVEEQSVHEIASSMNLRGKTASEAIRRMEDRMREIFVKRGLPEKYPEIIGRLPPPPPPAMQTITYVSLQG